MISHQGTQTIDTERLTLRPFSHADNENMLTYWVSDPNMLVHMKDPITTVGLSLKKILAFALGRLLYFSWTTRIIFAR